MAADDTVDAIRAAKVRLERAQQTLRGAQRLADHRASGARQRDVDRTQAEVTAAADDLLAALHTALPDVDDDTFDRVFIVASALIF